MRFFLSYQVWFGFDFMYLKFSCNILLLCNTAFQIGDTQMLNLIIVLYFMPLLLLLPIGTLISVVNYIGLPYPFLFGPMFHLLSPVYVDQKIPKGMGIYMTQNHSVCFVSWGLGQSGTKSTWICLGPISHDYYVKNGWHHTGLVVFS